MDNNFLDKKQLKLLKKVSKEKSITVSSDSEENEVLKFLRSYKLVRQMPSPQKDFRCYIITQMGKSALSERKSTDVKFWLSLILSIVAIVISIVSLFE